MKNSKRILAVLLTMVMVVGCMAAYTFTSAAESTDLTSNAYITMGRGGDVTETLTNGTIGSDLVDLGYWADAVAGPAYGTSGKCYIQIDLGTLCTVDSVWAANYVSGSRVYKWDLYYSDTLDKDISTWAKVEGRTSDEVGTVDGYTVTFDSPVTAKYIRLYGTYHSDNVGYHFSEVKVMGNMVDPNATLEYGDKVLEPTETVQITLGPSAFGEWENWGSTKKTNALTGLTAGPDGKYNEMIMTGLAKGTYTAKITLTDETAGKTYIIPQYFFDTPSMEFYNAVPHFFRFAFTEYGIPLVVGNAYTIAMDVLKGDQVLWSGSTAKGEFDDWSKADEVIINDVPHDYIESGEEPDVPVEPEGPTAITIYPNFGKWENWINSPNNPNGVGTEPGVTQLLVGITANGATVDISKDLTWVLTIKGGDQDKTITMAPATIVLDYQLYRFETCLGEGENQFIPVNGVDYTVTIQVFDGEELVYVSEPTAGFVCPMDPVVPEVEEPDEPIDPPVTPDEPDTPDNPPATTGDAAIYATIMVAVAAVALAVVFKRRTNI